jgi:hypothetical protein
MQFVADVSNYLLLIKNNKYMNKCLYTYTRKKRKYAYIYIWEKKRQHRQHNPDEAIFYMG